MPPAQLSVSAAGEFEKVLAVAAPNLGLIPVMQLLERVLADGVEHSIARLPCRAGLGDHQRFVDEPGQRRKYVAGGAVRDTLGGRQLEPAGEHRELDEEVLLFGTEQPIAPVDSGAQRLVARQRRAAASCQQPEAVVKSQQDVIEGQDAREAGRKLDRQRDAFQASADLRDSRRRGCVELESRPAEPRSLDEQPHGLALQQHLGARAAGRVGNTQRGRAPDDLAWETERLAAGDEHRYLRARTLDSADQRRARLHQVLAAVKHQQHPAGRKRLQEDFEDRPLSLLAHATGGGDRQLEKACIQDGRELDEEDAVAMSLDEVSGEAQRQPGFARAAGPCQGDQSRAVEQAPQLGQLMLAADEAADLGGEIVWRGHDGPGDYRALYEISPVRWPIPG